MGRNFRVFGSLFVSLVWGVAGYWCSTNAPELFWKCVALSFIFLMLGRGTDVEDEE